MPRENPYATAARIRKAEALFWALKTIGASGELAAGMSDEQWRMASQACKVNPPSKTTREMVVSLLNGRAAIAS